MKVTQIALATAAAFALAGPTLAAGDAQRDSTRSPQGMQQYDRSTGTQSTPGSTMGNQGARDTTAAPSQGLGGDRTSGTGYNSSTVREVQQALKDKGIEVGPVDGIFGPKTQSAVREFQQKEGISATGRIDRQTLAALDVDGNPAGMGTGRSGMGGSSSPGMSNREGMNQRDLKGANPSPSPESTQAGKTGVPRSSQ